MLTSSEHVILHTSDECRDALLLRVTELQCGQTRFVEENRRLRASLSIYDRAAEWRSTLRLRLVEFHRAMGQPILDKPAVPSHERVRLRARLIAEEFFEVLEALFTIIAVDVIAFSEVKAYVNWIIDNGSVVVLMPELADGLADLDYVIEGTRLEFGIDGEPIAREVHRSNMAKVGGSMREDGKIQKPEGWTPPDIEGELRKQGWNR
jgi:predicted HAD superfamily Cof-like phosphohydrolase